MCAAAVNYFVLRDVFDLFFVFDDHFGYIVVLREGFPLVKPTSIKHIKFIIK